AVSQRGIMRDENQRCAPAAMQVEQKIDDLIARFPVEIACRLVGENDQWVRRERSSNGHTLLFATRKLGREVAGPVTKSNLLQHRLRDCEGIAVTCEFQRKRHVFQRCHRWHEMERLENDADLPPPDERQLVLVERREIMT